MRQLCVCRPLQFDRRCPGKNFLKSVLEGGSAGTSPTERVQSVPDPVSPATGAKTTPLGKMLAPSIATDGKIGP
jgi:hypothetical protein